MVMDLRNSRMNNSSMERMVARLQIMAHHMVFLECRAGVISAGTEVFIVWSICRPDDIAIRAFSESRQSADVTSALPRSPIEGMIQWLNNWPGSGL